MNRTGFRCPGCLLIVEPEFQGGDPISYCCDEVSERICICRICDERETHTGCNECFPCLVEAVIADPSELETCSQSLQVEIAREMANRLRPFLRQRQAA